MIVMSNTERRRRHQPQILFGDNKEMKYKYLVEISQWNDDKFFLEELERKHTNNTPMIWICSYNTLPNNEQAPKTTEQVEDEHAHAT